MNPHCQSCLRLHLKKWAACLLTLIDLLLSARQVLFISADPDPYDTYMLCIVVARTLITWMIFVVCVTSLNRMLECHTDAGAILRSTKGIRVKQDAA
jgi:hypothetical protein